MTIMVNAVKANFRRDRVGTNGHPEARPSRVTYMAHGKGWVMCRHPGCVPFAVTEKRWLEFPFHEEIKNG